MRMLFRLVLLCPDVLGVFALVEADAHLAAF
jgi:hypothetical protein